MLGEMCKTGGELNYVISMAVIGFLDKRRKRYDTLALIVGVLTDCLGEFRRRVISSYEDKKIVQNGDIYREVIDG